MKHTLCALLRILCFRCKSFFVKIEQIGFPRLQDRDREKATDGERKSIKIKEKYPDPEQENHIMGACFTLSGGNGGGVHRGWDGNSLYHRIRARLRQGGQLRLVTY